MKEKIGKHPPMSFALKAAVSTLCVALMVGLAACGVIAAAPSVAIGASAVAIIFGPVAFFYDRYQSKKREEIYHNEMKNFMNFIPILNK